MHAHTHVRTYLHNLYLSELEFVLDQCEHGAIFHSRRHQNFRRIIGVKNHHQIGVHLVVAKLRELQGGSSKIHRRQTHLRIAHTHMYACISIYMHACMAEHICY